MNYEDMSDFEINQMVTCELFDCHEWSVNKEGTFYHCGLDGSGYVIQTVADYCNNPSDAWPIIIENKISITGLNPARSRGWEADAVCKMGLGCPAVEHENPLRAAMIVFLMMQEQDK